MSSFFEDISAVLGELADGAQNAVAQFAHRTAKDAAIAAAALVVQADGVIEASETQKVADAICRLEFLKKFPVGDLRALYHDYCSKAADPIGRAELLSFIRKMRGKTDGQPEIVMKVAIAIAKSGSDFGEPEISVLSEIASEMGLNIADYPLTATAASTRPSTAPYVAPPAVTKTIERAQSRPKGQPAQELVKGQRIPVGNSFPPGSSVIVGIGWEFAAGVSPFELTASAVLLNGAKQVIATVGLQQTYSNGCIVHMGNTALQSTLGDDQKLTVGLDRIPEDVSSILFAIAPSNGAAATGLASAYIRLYGAGTEVQLARFEAATNGSLALIALGRLYRYENSWKLHAIGEPVRTSTYAEALTTTAALF